MSKGRFAVLLVLSAFASPIATAQAAAPSRENQAQCALNQYTIGAVVPYEVEVRAGQGTVSELRGAQLYVPAQPGLTAEWLQLTLQREFARSSNAGGVNACSFNSNVRIEVVSGGTGFWVRLIAPDAKEGARVLERAKELAAAQAAAK